MSVLSRIPFAARGFHRFRRVFTLFLATYFLTLLLPTASTLFLYNRLLGIMEKNSVQDALSKLETVGTDLLYQINTMDTTASLLVFDTEVARMLTMPPLTDGDPRVNTFVRFSAYIDEKMSSFSRTSLGYRLLFKENELIFYNGAMSSGLEFYYTHSLRYDGMTYAQWTQAVFSSHQRTLLPADQIHMNSAVIHAITYNYPIARKTAHGTRMAVLQFFIPVESLVPVYHDASASGYLFDTNGQTLAAFGLPQAEPLAFEQLLSGGGNSFRHDSNLVIQKAVSPSLVLALSIPLDAAFKEAIALKTPMLLMIGFCAIVEAILCFYFAKLHARPIERFASNVKPLLSATVHRNEYAYFDQSIAQLQKSQETAEHATAQKQRAEAFLLLNKVFDDRAVLADDILLQGDAIHLDLRAQTYCVAMLVANQPEFHFAEENAYPEAPEGLRAIAHMLRRDCLALLYLCDRGEADFSYKPLLAHLQSIREQLPFPVHIGVGRCYCTVDNIAFSFQQADYSSQQEGAFDVAVYDNISRNFNSLHFPLEQQQRILNAVKHNNASVINLEFERIIKENTQKRHLTSLLKKTLLCTLDGLLLTAAEEVVQEENLSDYLRTLPRPNDFRECIETLRDEFIRIGATAQKRYSSHSSLRKQELLSYFENHYTDPSQSISAVSSHFNLSESYISILCKDLLGESYSSYLEKMRLAKAKELLCRTDQSIEEVAQSVGYNNSTTFRRAFKRIVGISPLQHKQQRMHAGDRKSQTL